MQAVIGPKDDDDESDTSGGAYSETGETSGTDDDNSITKTRGGEPDGNDLIVTLSTTPKNPPAGTTLSLSWEIESTEGKPVSIINNNFGIEGKGEIRNYIY